jgi:16S rRNA (guanine1516-N2)-methyltransferase
MLERSPIIAALLEDGLRRVRYDETLGSILRDRIDLECVDAIDHFDTLSETERPEIIYLDPMYPQRKKDAKSKKEMRVLRDIVGKDEDAGTIIRKALKCAVRRVVVKRPRHAPSLPGPAPFTAIHGKTTRYDIYPVKSACTYSYDVADT